LKNPQDFSILRREAGRKPPAVSRRRITMEDDIWNTRYWAYAPTLHEVELGELLGIAWSAEELRKVFGEDISVWDAKERDWV
jgi:hypothetical protein